MKATMVVLIWILTLSSVGIGAEYESFKGNDYLFKGDAWMQIIDGEEVPNPMLSITVKFNPQLDEKDIFDLIEYYDCKLRYVSQSGYYFVAPTEYEDEIETANMLYADNNIVDVWVDEIQELFSIPNDPGFLPPQNDLKPWHGQWELYTDLSLHYATRPPYADLLGAEVESAWEDINWDTANPTYKPIIAIYDAGFDINHPDLTDNLWCNPLEYNGIDNFDDDGNGYVDDIHGTNVEYSTTPYRTSSDSSMMRDNWHYYFQDLPDTQPPGFAGEAWHGTTVAGAAAAKSNNNIGIASPGSGWNGNQGVQIMCLTADNWRPRENFVRAIDYATSEGARILNLSMSWDQTVTGQALREAFNNNQIITFSGAGNDAKQPQFVTDIQVNNSVIFVGMTNLIGSNYNWNPNLNPLFPDPIPPFYEIRSAYAVWVEEDTIPDHWAVSGSDYGSQLDMVAARAGCLLNDVYLDSVHGQQNQPNWRQTQGYTSQTSPLAASIAGLVLANYPTLTTSELMQIMLESCSKFEGVPGQYHAKRPPGYYYPQAPNLTTWGNPNYYTPYGDPDKYLSSEYTYDATNPNGNLYGSWDLQVGYGKVSAKNALWYAENRADVLGEPNPVTNLHVVIIPAMVGMTIDWDASTSPDISHYRLSRSKHYDGTTGTLDVDNIVGTSWHDGAFEPQDGGEIDMDDYCDYRVWAVDKSGLESTSELIRVYVDGTILIPNPKRTVETQPLKFSFEGAYPNPFNQMTTFKFTLPETGRTQILIFAVNGRLADSILDSEMSSGIYNISWNSRDLSSGVYFVRLSTDTHSATRKIVLVK